jgi:hypothetical protein
VGEGDEVKEPSCTVVEMWRTFKTNFEGLRRRGDRSQGHGTCREFEASEREKVKREQCGKECAKEMRWLLKVEGGRKLRDLCSRERPQGRDRRALP